MQPGRERQLVTAAILLGMLLAALEATAVATAVPTAVGELGGRRPLQLGLLRLPADLHHHRAAVRQARRPLRPQAHLSLAVAIFLLGSALCGVAAHLPAAHPLPRHPGAGRRRGVAGRHHHHRATSTPWRSAAASRGSSPGSGRSRACRAAARRADHRHPLLAVDLLSQHPLRHCSPPGCSSASCARRSPASAPAGHPGHGQPTVAVTLLLLALLEGPGSLGWGDLRTLGLLAGSRRRARRLPLAGAAAPRADARRSTSSGTG